MSDKIYQIFENTMMEWSRLTWWNLWTCRTRSLGESR